MKGTHEHEWEESPRYVDSHLHLDMKPFEGEVEAVLERARAAGVAAFVAVAAEPGSYERTVELARAHRDVHATAGIHPHEASVVDESHMARVAELARLPEVVAVGETGLDYFYDHSTPEEQKRWFLRHFEVAREVGKPLVVHTRGAEPEVAEIVASEAGRDVRGVAHCYTGDVESAKRLVDLGWLVSFTGIVTFKKAEEVRDVVRALPIERLMIETDAPYLAPVPHRGKRNEPAYVVRVAEALAEIKGLSVADVARITTENARQFFGLALEHDFRIAYRIRNSLYLNVTNRCTLACTFCGKFRDFTVKGHDLRLRGGEPSAEQVLEALGDPEGVDEVVFCGYGEPTLRLEVVEEVSRRLKERHPGLRIRLNTDGLGNLVHGRDVPAELAGLIDSVSVSLNAPDAATYVKICPNKHGEKAFPAVLDFLRSARQHLPDVQASAVTVPGLDVEAVRRLAEDELGVRFRARDYNEIG